MVADRIRGRSPTSAWTSVVAAPDCGMKYLPRETGLELESLAAGAGIIRAESA